MRATLKHESAKSDGLSAAVRLLVPGILAAVLAIFWAVAPARAAVTQMRTPSPSIIEITGGSGRQAWRLRYGTMEIYKKLLVEGEGKRAWFSHAGWLRLIDTEKGQVMGRWRFPGQIVNLVAREDRVQVEIEERYGVDERLRRTLEFDSAAPSVPYWPPNFFIVQRASTRETSAIWPEGNFFGPPDVKTPPERARQILPELEEAIRRDPEAPWFRVALGWLLRYLGDPRAEAVYREGIQLPQTHFTELLQISAFLEGLGERALAREAFERGYRDFWQKGNDPRLFVALINRITSYSLRKESWAAANSEHRAELIERLYKLMPRGEGASLAWDLYANSLQDQGRGSEAQLWRQRAREARASENWMYLPGVVWVDLVILVALAAALAALVYFLVLFARYRPQHRITAVAPAALGRRKFGFFNTVYWSRSERIAFLLIVLVGWYAAGLASWQVRAILRVASMPVSMGAGSLAGPVNIHAIQDRLPATPERELLLAVAYQQDGQVEQAAELYRRLPQFAESWNNLGVILKQEGKDQEAQEAFEKALQLDPNLAEAALNLGRPSHDEWAALHQKYLPGQPMLAPPRAVRFQRAFRGGGTGTLLLRALLGPWAGESPADWGKLVG